MHSFHGEKVVGYCYCASFRAWMRRAAGSSANDTPPAAISAPQNRIAGLNVPDVSLINPENTEIIFMGKIECLQQIL